MAVGRVLRRRGVRGPVGHVLIVATFDELSLGPQLVPITAALAEQSGQ